MKFLLIITSFHMYASISRYTTRFASPLGDFFHTFIPSKKVDNDIVLVIPGLGGSKLIDCNRTVWPPRIKDLLLHNKKWRYDIMNNTEISVREFGDINAFDLDSRIPFFNNHLHKVVNDIDGKTIPYDFRKLNNKAYLTDFYTRLNAYIEDMDYPIALLAHSTGGLLIHWFLYNKSAWWKEKYIKRVTYVSVPFGGTVRTLKNIINWSNLKDFVRLDILSSMGGYSINMPNNKCISPILTVDGVIKDDYLNFLNMFDVKSMCDFNDDMIQSFSKSNGIKTYVVYGDESVTPTSISIIHGCMSIIYGDGDGIAPIESLRVPETWNQSNVETVVVHGAGHSSILTSFEFNMFLKRHNR